MKKISLFTIAIILLLTLTGCPETVETSCIVVKNVSESGIVVAALKTRDFIPNSNKIVTIRDNHCLYDTVLTESNNYFFYDIAPNTKQEIYTYFDDDYYDDDVYITDTVTLFILDEAVYNSHSWQTIVDNNEILARYDIPAKYYFDNFSRRNPITYPPTEYMSGIVVRKFD